jgi:hypothetical protein
MMAYEESFFDSNKAQLLYDLRLECIPQNISAWNTIQQLQCTLAFCMTVLSEQE